MGREERGGDGMAWDGTKWRRGERWGAGKANVGKKNVPLPFVFCVGTWNRGIKGFVVAGLLVQPISFLFFS